MKTAGMVVSNAGTTIMKKVTSMEAMTATLMEAMTAKMLTTKESFLVSIVTVNASTRILPAGKLATSASMISSVMMIKQEMMTIYQKMEKMTMVRLMVTSA